jgi:hypothetical protein
MHFFIIILLLGLSAFKINAQNRVDFFDGDDLKGRVQLRGELQDTILPKHGPFSAHWRELDGDYINTFVVNGGLQNHLPQGVWSWQQARWSYSISAGNNIKPDFKTQGISARWSAYFEKGVPDRQWIYTLDSLDNDGRITQKLMHVKFIYKSGVVAGRFVVEDFRKDTYFKVSGTTDNEGNASGVWEYQYHDAAGNLITENHHYLKGLLLKVYVFATDTQEINFKTNQQFINAANADSSVRIGALRYTDSEFKGVGNEKWSEILNEYYKSGWRLPVFPYTFDLNIPFFKRLEYPLSVEEEQFISQIKSNSEFIKSEIDNYVQGGMLILRSRSSAMDLSISFLEQTRLRMQMIDSLIARTELPSFTYKNRYQPGILRFIQSINEMAEVRAQIYDTLNLQLPLILPDTANFRLFYELNKLTEISKNTLAEHFEVIGREIFVLQREDERKNLEEQLMENLKALQDLFGNENGIGAHIRNVWINEMLQQEIIRYAQNDDYESAMNLGQSILSRIDTIKLMKDRVAVFDSMPYRIHKEYQRFVYNPYTGKNDLEMIVKKRFVNTVLENLWPWLENNVKKEESWSKFKLLWEQQFEVYNYVMTFANREDRQANKINKRVRKETNPERILRFLN